MTTKKKTQILIRAALDEDIEPCLAVDHGLETNTIWQMQFQEGEERTQTSFQTLRLPRPIRVEYPRSRSELSRELENAALMLVAEADGVLLGYTHLELVEWSHSVWVRNLVVDEPWRRRRVGRALLAQATAWAKQKKAKRITVETTARSYPAIQFFASRGLSFCGYHDRYYTSQDIAVFFGQAL